MNGSVTATPEIATVSRCIFPGGKAVLMGYDRDGKEVFGLGVRTKNVVRWGMQGVQNGDFVWLMKAYVEWLQHDSGNDGTTP